MSKPTRSDFVLDRFKGLNELVDPVRLEPGWLDVANNIDITDEESIRRRSGVTKITAFINPRSLYSDGNIHLFAEDTNFRLITNITETTCATTILLSNIDRDAKFNYAKVNDRIYLTNGQINGMVLPNGSYHNWSVETPAGQPALSAVGGSFPTDSTFHVFVTFIDDLGRESGAGQASTITLSSGGGFTVSSIPVPSSADIIAKSVYVTQPNGDIFYLYRDLPINQTSLTISGFSHNTIQATNMFLSGPPLGQDIAYSSGRIWIAKDNYVFWTEPLIYHLFKLRENYFSFPETVNMIIPVENGIYVSSDKTYFISSIVDDPKLDHVSNDTAITGTKIEMFGEALQDGSDPSVIAAWASEGGIIIGDENGSVKNITNKSVAFDRNIPYGAMLLRSDGGYSRIVTSLLQGQESNALRATDYVTATVVRCAIPDFQNQPPLMDSNLITFDQTDRTFDEAV
jgi:hypothetical protein